MGAAFTGNTCEVCVSPCKTCVQDVQINADLIAGTGGKGGTKCTECITSSDSSRPDGEAVVVTYYLLMKRTEWDPSQPSKLTSPFVRF